MTKEFLSKNNLQCVRSDKTNRFVVCNSEDLTKKNEIILQDNTTYQVMNKSKAQAIENQANKLIKTIIKNSSLHDQSDKLISTGTNPAKFFSFIKDHKDKTDEGFQVRPIASVRNTPIEKIDWVVSRILSQTLPLVPANLVKTEELINMLNNLHTCNLDNKVFISLDVQSLYPSIPLETGIEYNMKHLRKHWDRIDSFGISVENIEKLMTFICYNYEIEYNGKTYKQIKGVPMGCHFAPPFAIIFLHTIESKALGMLGFDPTIYKRYIDDIILGPLDYDENKFNQILNVFNSINPNIKFTLEAPKPSEWLNFLDIKIKIDNEIKYSWYHKECHSNIALRKDSFLPRHIKSNYIKSSAHTISQRSNDPEIRKENLAEFDRILEQNQYTEKEREISTKTKKSNKRNSISKENNFQFKVPYVNDRCNRKINKLIKKYDLPVRLINEYGYQSANYLNNNKKEKSCSCNICSDFKNNKYSCRDRYVVYQYTCVQCGEFYIGKTARMLKTRHQEHRKAIDNKSNSSALYNHLQDKHGGIGGIGNFQVGLIRKLHNTRDTTIAEAKAITQLKPQINRKHELPDYNLSSQFDNHANRQHTS